MYIYTWRPKIEVLSQLYEKLESTVFQNSVQYMGHNTVHELLGLRY